MGATEQSGRSGSVETGRITWGCMYDPINIKIFESSTKEDITIEPAAGLVLGD